MRARRRDEASQHGVVAVVDRRPREVEDHELDRPHNSDPLSLLYFRSCLYNFPMVADGGCRGKTR